MNWVDLDTGLWEVTFDLSIGQSSANVFSQECNIQSGRRCSSSTKGSKRPSPCLVLAFNMVQDELLLVQHRSDLFQPWSPGDTISSGYTVPLQWNQHSFLKGIDVCFLRAEPKKTNKVEILIQPHSLFSGYDLTTAKGIYMSSTPPCQANLHKSSEPLVSVELIWHSWERTYWSPKIRCFCFLVKTEACL